jgi:hypothetical protein
MEQEVKKENYQVCATLDIENVYETLTNPLLDLMSLQKDIQENVYGYNFEKLRQMPLSEMKLFFDMNYHAIQDELREVYQALGGVKDGIGSAVWKKWKKDHAKSYQMPFHEMSLDDRKELMFELVDIQHFLFNMMIAVGMTPEILTNMYFAKNKENRNRQLKGY